MSEQEVVQFARLQETKESICQYMRNIGNTGEALGGERCNIFEDIIMTGSSCGISVSTIKDLAVARQINLSGQARHLVIKLAMRATSAIDGLTQLTIESIKTRPVDKVVSKGPLFKDPTIEASQGSEHYGCGFNLASSTKPK